MQTIKVYLYNQKVEVQIVDPTIFTTRNRVVYSHPIVVYQGIDNPLQVVLKNQDQKSVDLTGYVVQADIQDPTNKVTIESFAVTWIDITKGVGSLTIDRQTLDSLEQRLYKLTFKRIKQSDNTERPLFIDDNYGVPIDLQVKPAYYSRVESMPGQIDTVFDGGVI
jgi:hypothetical protein